MTCLCLSAFKVSEFMGRKLNLSIAGVQNEARKHDYGCNFLSNLIGFLLAFIKKFVYIYIYICFNISILSIFVIIYF